MSIDIKVLMYIYLFICFSLLIYNIGYIINLKIEKRKQYKHCLFWQNKIQLQLNYLKVHQQIEDTHHKLLTKKLIKTKELLAFIEALEILKKEQLFNIYIENIYTDWQFLALKYAKKDNMNKAFFAYVIATYPPVSKNDFSLIIQILLSYFNNSTIYCRENVLNALYALGNVQAVENALQMINDNHWFHHQKLLADGLAKFNGDKEKLMAKLWSHLNDWDENIMISIIQFINQCDGPYQETFLPVLQSDHTQLEIRLAIIRYYRRHIHPPVKTVLQAFLDDPKINESILIVSTFAIDQYKDEKTILLLKKCLHHHNWYIRYNAARSLFNLHISLESLHDILTGKDRFAKEIIEYIYHGEKQL